MRVSDDGRTSRVELNATGKELKAVLSRALNTWEPINYPPWALALCDRLEDDDFVYVLCVRGLTDAEKGTNTRTPA